MLARGLPLTACIVAAVAAVAAGADPCARHASCAGCIASEGCGQCLLPPITEDGRTTQHQICASGNATGPTTPGIACATWSIMACASSRRRVRAKACPHLVRAAHHDGQATAPWTAALAASATRTGFARAFPAGVASTAATSSRCARLWSAAPRAHSRSAALPRIRSAPRKAGSAHPLGAAVRPYRRRPSHCCPGTGAIAMWRLFRAGSRATDVEPPVPLAGSVR